MQFESKVIKRDKRTLKQKLTATKIDEYARDVTPNRNQKYNKKVDPPLKLKKARVWISEIKNSDSTRIISKLQEFSKSI